MVKHKLETDLMHHISRRMKKVRQEREAVLAQRPYSPTGAIEIRGKKRAFTTAVLFTLTRCTSPYVPL